jgi:hypothetical protein
MVGLPRFESWQTNHIYNQTCLKGYIYTTNRGKPSIYTVKPDLKGTSKTTNRGKPTIYTVKPDLKGTSIQQIVVNHSYILSNRFDYIYGWFTMICCIDVPFKSGLTVYMVGLPRFVE